MIMKLEEENVMIVLSDYGSAFKDEFKYIGDFLDNRMKLKLPLTLNPILLCLYDSEELEDIKEEEIKSKKYHRYIRKVVKLLEEKIFLR